jgi:dephospho-CoA kinase
MLLVGLTGGIASGKSVVAAMFRDQGAYIIDLDVIARKIVSPGSAGWREVVAAFGNEILHEDGTLNRKQLGSIVFSDPERRKMLEDILHPKIYREQSHEVQKIVDQDERAIILVDIPLLIEVNKQKSFDRIVLVSVSPDIQLERLVKRDGYGMEEARKRIDSQMAIDSKKQFAHHVIDNGGSQESTLQQVKGVFRILRKVEAQKRSELH